MESARLRLKIRAGGHCGIFVRAQVILASAPQPWIRLTSLPSLAAHQGRSHVRKKMATPEEERRLRGSQEGRRRPHQRRSHVRKKMQRTRKMMKGRRTRRGKGDSGRRESKRRRSGKFGTQAETRLQESAHPQLSCSLHSEGIGRSTEEDGLKRSPNWSTSRFSEGRIPFSWAVKFAWPTAWRTQRLAGDASLPGQNIHRFGRLTCCGMSREETAHSIRRPSDGGPTMQRRMRQKLTVLDTPPCILER